jgi:HK97 family phage major capsid protein
MPTYKELEAERVKKAAELKSFLDSKKTDDGGYDMDGEAVKTVRDRKAELDAIGEKADAARELELINAAAVKAARLPMPSADQHPKGGPDEPGTDQGATKSLGELFTESAEFKANQNSGDARYKTAIKSAALAALKTVMTTAAGFSPANNRGPIVVPFATRRPMIADLIPQDHTENSVIRYMEFTTWTNSSAAVAEGAAKPESALAATERQVALEAIATYLPVTEQQLRYVPQLRAVIDNVLTLMLQLTEETQLLYGNGTVPNLQGFLTKTGVGSYALGTGGTKENIADAFYAAFTQIRTVGFAEPSGGIINPNDWQIVRLMKTTQGAYIWGNPDEAGPERLWGKPVIPTMAITAGTGLTGDFATWAHIDRAMDITIEVGYQNDDFTKNKKTIRAEEYVALEILRPSAFSQVTGLAYVAP